MDKADTIPCREVRVDSRVQAAAVYVFPTLPAWLAVLVLAEAAWMRWGAGLLLAASAVVLVFGGTWRRAGYVLELADGAIRIRRAHRRWRRLQPGRVVTAGDVEDGYLETPSCLVLRLASGTTISADLACERAREVLDHLGITLERRTLSAPLTGGFDPFPWVPGAVWFAVLAALGLDRSLHPLLGSPLLLGAGLAVVGTLAFAQRLKPRVIVGLDGVRIAGVLRSKFMPYRAIENVTRAGPRDSRIVLETSAGTVPLSCDATSTKEIDALLSQIEQGRAAAAAAQAAPPLELLDRRGRPFGVWRTALRGLALAERGFRGAALCESDLHLVLGDPEAPLERRVGAALALRSRAAESRDRIRVAAATSAEPRARVALEAAAADRLDERAIEAELDELGSVARAATRQARERGG